MARLYQVTRDWILPVSGLHPTHLGEFLDKAEVRAKRRGIAVKEIALEGICAVDVDPDDGWEIDGVRHESVSWYGVQYTAHLDDGKVLTFCELAEIGFGRYSRDVQRHERALKTFMDAQQKEIQQRGHGASVGDRVQTLYREAA